MHSSSSKTYFVKTAFLVLFTAASSPIGEGFNKNDLVLYAKHHTSWQKPIICQIYSRSTKKHIQILQKKIRALGEHGNEWSKVEKRSHTFGVVTIRGVLSNRYLCMSKRGKLAARKKLSSDGSCRFIENITSAYWTSFRSESHPDWYVGFSGKSGRPKRGRKTSANQEACNFLIRDHEAQDPVKPLPEHMRDLVLNLQRKLHYSSGLTRKRRHRYQTDDPIEDDIDEDVINSLPNWIRQPPTNSSPDEEREWIIRVQNVINNLPPRTPRTPTSNATMSSFEMDNIEPATSKPEKSKRRKHSRHKSNSPRNSRKKRRRQKTAVGSRPTSTPSRRGLAGEMSVPKTPVRSQSGDEPTEAPNISSPKLSEMQIRHSKKLLTKPRRTGADINSDTETDGGEPDEVGDFLNINDLNNIAKSKTNIINNKDNISRTNAPTASRSSLAHSRRAKRRRAKLGRTRRTR